MASPSVTYTFVNGNVADASQVNQNFTDLISSLTDGTKTLNIDALTCAGTFTANGNTTIGNAASDTCDIASQTSFNLGLSPNAKAGADADATLTIASNKFTNVTCTAARVYKLPTTGVKAGDTWTFINRATNETYRLNLQASSDSGTTYIDWIVNGKITVMALQDTPTVAAHWVTTNACMGWLTSNVTASFTTNTTTTSKATRDGEDAKFQVKLAFTGTPDAGGLVLTLPTGYTIDTSKLVSASTDSRSIFGQGDVFSGASSSTVTVGYFSTTQVIVNALAASGSYVDSGSIVSKTVPFTLANGTFIAVEFTVPISEWAMFN